MPRTRMGDDIDVRNIKLNPDEQRKRLDDVSEMSRWGFDESKCGNCGADNSQIKGLLMQCAKCRLAYYCSKKCFNDDLERHSKFCDAAKLQYEPNAKESSDAVSVVVKPKKEKERQELLNTRGGRSKTVNDGKKEEKKKKAKKKKDKKAKKKKKKKKSSSSKEDLSDSVVEDSESGDEALGKRCGSRLSSRRKKSLPKKKQDASSESDGDSDDDESEEDSGTLNNRRGGSRLSSRKKKSLPKKMQEDSSESDEDSDLKGSKQSRSRLSSRRKKNLPKKKQLQQKDSSESDEDSDEEAGGSGEEAPGSSKRIGSRLSSRRKKCSPKKKKLQQNNSSGSDEDSDDEVAWDSGGEALGSSKRTGRRPSSQSKKSLSKKKLQQNKSLESNEDSDDDEAADLDNKVLGSSKRSGSRLSSRRKKGLPNEKHEAEDSSGSDVTGDGGDAEEDSATATSKNNTRGGAETTARQCETDNKATKISSAATLPTALAAVSTRAPRDRSTEEESSDESYDDDESTASYDEVTVDDDDNDLYDDEYEEVSVHDGDLNDVNEYYEEEVAVEKEACGDDANDEGGGGGGGRRGEAIKEAPKLFGGAGDSMRPGGMSGESYDEGRGERKAPEALLSGDDVEEEDAAEMSEGENPWDDDGIKEAPRVSANSMRPGVIRGASLIENSGLEISDEVRSGRKRRGKVEVEEGGGGDERIKGDDDGIKEAPRLPANSMRPGVTLGASLIDDSALGVADEVRSGGKRPGKLDVEEEVVVVVVGYEGIKEEEDGIKEAPRASESGFMRPSAVRGLSCDDSLRELGGVVRKGRTTPETNEEEEAEEGDEGIKEAPRASEGGFVRPSAVRGLSCDDNLRELGGVVRKGRIAPDNQEEEEEEEETRNHDEPKSIEMKTMRERDEEQKRQAMEQVDCAKTLLRNVLEGRVCPDDLDEEEWEILRRVVQWRTIEEDEPNSPQRRFPVGSGNLEEPTPFEPENVVLKPIPESPTKSFQTVPDWAVRSPLKRTNILDLRLRIDEASLKARRRDELDYGSEATNNDLEFFKHQLRSWVSDNKTSESQFNDSMARLQDSVATDIDLLDIGGDDGSEDGMEGDEITFSPVGTHRGALSSASVRNAQFVENTTLLSPPDKQTERKPSWIVKSPLISPGALGSPRMTSPGARYAHSLTEASPPQREPPAENKPDWLVKSPLKTTARGMLAKSGFDLHKTPTKEPNNELPQKESFPGMKSMPLM